MIWNREMETMARPELRVLQLRRLQETVQRAYARVSFYRQAFDAAGVRPEAIRSLDDLARLPFTRKQHLRENYPFGLFAVPRQAVARIHASSGTKGKPTVVGYTRHDLEVWAECCARSLGCAGGEPGHILHNAYGYGLFTGGLGLHQGGERMGLTVVPVSGGNSARQVLLIQDFKPEGICCTPSYMLNLIDYMRDNGVDPHGTGLRYGIFGAEPWTPQMREQIEEWTGMHAVDIYGLSEVIGPGVSCECWEEKAGAHINEDHFLVELINPQTLEPVPPGEAGELVFTSLTKEACPVIRYRTGDIASLNPAACRCGRSFVRMSRVKGRVDDMLIIRGVNLYPSEVEAVLLSIDELAPHYQLILSRPKSLDELEVHVEVTEPVHDQWHARGLMPAHQHFEALARRVSQELQAMMGLHCTVRVSPPKTVPRSEGKAIRIVDQRLR